VRHYPFVGADKVVHAGAFGTLAFLVAWGLFRAVPNWPHLRSLLVAFFSAVVYGGSDEIHQIFVPRRYSDPLDVAADATGALIAVVLVYLWETRPRGQKGGSAQGR